jgi:hypothetical protein
LRYVCLFAIWLCLLLSVAFTVIAVGFIAKFLIDGSKLNLDPRSADFALYKNSRFRECHAREPPSDATSCPDVWAQLDKTEWPVIDTHGMRIIDRPTIFSENRTRTQTPNGSPLTYDWCEAVSCLDSSFKVVPSTPRDSVLGATPLTAWTSITITLFINFWDFRRRLWPSPNKPKQACRALGEVPWYDWVLHAYSVCSFVWWWVSFARFAAAPAHTVAPGPIGWLVPWRNSNLLRYHPYACAAAAARERRGKKPLSLARIFAWLAFLHWIATIYVLYLQGPKITRSGLGYQSYDCVSTFTAAESAAPGVSTCSAGELCANPWFLADPGFRSGVVDYGFAALTSFICFSIGAILACGIFLNRLEIPFKAMTDRPVSADKAKKIREDATVDTTMFLAMSSAVVIGGCGIIFTISVVLTNSQRQEGTVTIFPACNAVHVGVSPWRFYLDVDQNQKVLRLVKMWFNS